MSNAPSLSPRTLAAQALGTIDERTRAIVPPIHLATTFERDPDNLYRSGNSYGRPDNDTVRQAEAIIGALEGASTTFIFGSGMSAAIALFLEPRAGRPCGRSQGHVLGFARLARQRGASFRDQRRFRRRRGFAGVRERSEAGKTKLVWLETPSNPLWGVSDIEGAARLAHAAGAVLAVELDLRDARLHPADRVRRRCGDALGDQISQRAFRRSRGRALLRAGRRDFRAGADNSPVAWNDPASVRGVPVDPGFANARRARARVGGERDGAREPPLQSCVRFRRALSGAPAPPGHDVARRQMKGGFGGMLSIRVRGGAEAAIATAARVRVWKRATSLGGVESLIEHRASIEGANSPCPPDLLRLVGRNRGRRGPMARYRRRADRFALSSRFQPRRRIRLKRAQCTATSSWSAVGRSPRD